MPPAKKVARVPKLLTLYKNEVFPLLQAAGFQGTVAKSGVVRGRGKFWFFASQRGDELQIDAFGTDGRRDHTFMNRRISVPEAKRVAEVRKLAKAVGRTLERIETMSAAPAVPEAASPAAALKLLLQRVAEELGSLPITTVRANGREVSVRVEGRRKAVVADRLAVLTLVRELWQRDTLTGKTGETARSIVEGDELEQYLVCLARESKADAKALLAHLLGPYDLPPPPDHPLRAVISKPLTATKSLVEASSAGALVRRALPFTTKGTLVDRLAAIWVVDFTLSYVATHRDADALLSEAQRVADSLARSKRPILAEAGWLLAEQVALARRPKTPRRRKKG